MKLTRDKIERLAFVKYLLLQAKTQKDLERPMSSSAILTIHDCIECFLQLCFEVTTGQAKTSSKNILDTYSEEINKIHKEQDKTQINKSYIKRINDLRNQLKHSTIFTDHNQIPNLYVETEMFLIDFTSLVFDISFNQMSLVELITNEDVKRHLIDAQNSIQKKEYQNAMWSIGKAFYEIKNNRTKVEGKYGENLLRKPFKVDYLIKYKTGLGGSEPDKILKENLKGIAKDINKLQDEIQNIKITLSLAVDLNEYMYFKEHIPYVSKLVYPESNEIKFWIPDEERKEEIRYNFETVKFCFDFVMELALKNEKANA
jgi:hypothetical protein